MRYRRIRRTDDPQLFLSARQGEDFGYDIPLARGQYELRLFLLRRSMAMTTRKAAANRAGCSR